MTEGQRNMEGKMGKFDDFELNLKVSEKEENTVGARSTPTILTTIPISKALGCTDGKECAMPTKDRPAASCHKAMAGAVQRRC